MAEEIRKILKEHNEDVKRHINILKEDFDGKVNLIGEQYGSIQKKLAEHDGRFQTIDGNLEIIKNDIEIIKNSLKKKVDIDDFEILEGRVRALESKIK